MLAPRLVKIVSERLFAVVLDMGPWPDCLAQDLRASGLEPPAHRAAPAGRGRLSARLGKPTKSMWGAVTRHVDAKPRSYVDQRRPHGNKKQASEVERIGFSRGFGDGFGCSMLGSVQHQFATLQERCPGMCPGTLLHEFTDTPRPGLPH